MAHKADIPIPFTDVSDVYPPPCPSCGAKIAINHCDFKTPSGSHHGIQMTHAEPYCVWVNTPASDWFFHALLDVELRKLSAS